MSIRFNFEAVAKKILDLFAADHNSAWAITGQYFYG